MLSPLVCHRVPLLCYIAQRDIRPTESTGDLNHSGDNSSIELPLATSNNFQSITTLNSLKIFRASSAIASNPLVARARIVGPAPDRQIPSSPGCVDGVILDVTSGSPGICEVLEFYGANQDRVLI